jgi:DNA-binding IclR family transcriptional regulator
MLGEFEHIKDPVGNLELAELTGLPKSTVSRVTAALARANLVVQKPGSEKYHLGPRVLALAQAYRRANPIGDLLAASMQKVADETRGTIGLAARDGMDMVYLNIWRGVSHITIRQDVGSRMPLASSAIGLAWLAGLRDHERKSVLAEIRTHDSANWPAVRDRVAQAVEEIEAHGYCTGLGVWQPDVNGAAVAFRSGGFGDTYALNLGGPSFWLTDELIRRDCGPRLRNALAGLAKAGVIDTVGNMSPQPHEVAFDAGD